MFRGIFLKCHSQLIRSSLTKQFPSDYTNTVDQLPGIKELDFLLQNGFAVPSEVPWAAPMFAVPNKNGQIQLIIEYQ